MALRPEISDWHSKREIERGLEEESFICAFVFLSPFYFDGFLGMICPISKRGLA